MSVKLSLTQKEAEALHEALLELHQSMNDDGREGYFESTPLNTIYGKLQVERHKFLKPGRSNFGQVRT